jgi:hypothetical protein
MRRAKQNSAADYCRGCGGYLLLEKPCGRTTKRTVIKGFRRKRLHPRTLFALYGAHFVLTLDCTQTNLLLWSWRRDLNPRPSDYKSDALPTELRQREPFV